MLFQCPPNLQYDRELIERFVGYLPPGPPAFAMEFRHASWNEAKDLLRDQGIARCVAETDERDPKPEELSWEPVGYLRLRKTEYGDEELEGGRKGSGPALESGADIFCYFKHEEDGVRPEEDGQAPRRHVCENNKSRSICPTRSQSHQETEEKSVARSGRPGCQAAIASSSRLKIRSSTTRRSSSAFPSRRRARFSLVLVLLTGCTAGLLVLDMKRNMLSRRLS